MTSTELLDAIAQRFACRAYADTPVPTELLHAVAEAGVRAPSAVNRQPWRLSVITDRAELDTIDRVGMANLKLRDPAGYERVIGRGGRLLYNAPAMIVICAQVMETPYPVAWDVGIVASHLLLAATALGLNSVVAAMPGDGFAGETGAELKARYIPEGFEFGLSVLLGYAAKPGTQHEPDFGKITYF